MSCVAQGPAERRESQARRPRTHAFVRRRRSTAAAVRPSSPHRPRPSRTHVAPGEAGRGERTDRELAERGERSGDESGASCRRRADLQDEGGSATGSGGLVSCCCVHRCSRTRRAGEARDPRVEVERFIGARERAPSRKKLDCLTVLSRLASVLDAGLEMQRGCGSPSKRMRLTRRDEHLGSRADGEGRYCCARGRHGRRWSSRVEAVAQGERRGSARLAGRKVARCARPPRAQARREPQGCSDQVYSESACSTQAASPPSSTHRRLPLKREATIDPREDSRRRRGRGEGDAAPREDRAGPAGWDRFRGVHLAQDGHRERGWKIYLERGGGGRARRAGEASERLGASSRNSSFARRPQLGWFCFRARAGPWSAGSTSVLQARRKSAAEPRRTDALTVVSQLPSASTGRGRGCAT